TISRSKNLQLTRTSTATGASDSSTRSASSRAPLQRYSSADKIKPHARRQVAAETPVGEIDTLERRQGDRKASRQVRRGRADARRDQEGRRQEARGAEETRT